jgi:hypothetical protein
MSKLLTRETESRDSSPPISLVLGEKILTSFRGTYFQAQFGLVGMISVGCVE